MDSMARLDKMLAQGVGGIHRILVANLLYRQMIDSGNQSLIERCFMSSHHYMINNDLQIVIERGNGSNMARIFSIMAVANACGQLIVGDVEKAKVYLLSTDCSIRKLSSLTSGNNPYIIRIPSDSFWYGSEYSRIYIEDKAIVNQDVIIFTTYRKGLCYVNNEGLNCFDSDTKKQYMIKMYYVIKQRASSIADRLRLMNKEIDVWAM